MAYLPDSPVGRKLLGLLKVDKTYFTIEEEEIVAKGVNEDSLNEKLEITTEQFLKDCLKYFKKQ